MEIDQLYVDIIVKRWEEWRSLSLPPVGEEINEFADDVTVFKMNVNQGYSGNVTTLQVPDDFKINHIGEYRDANGVMIEKSSARPLDFALLGEFQTADEVSTNPKRFVLYNCSAGRADLSGTTKEKGITASQFSIPITVASTPADEVVKATILKSANEAIFNSWFDSVYYNPELVATQRVTANVSDASGAIAGAVVVVGEKIAKTDTDGNASFMLPAGTYDVIVSAEGYTPDVDSVTVVSSAVSKTITLTEA